MTTQVRWTLLTLALAFGAAAGARAQAPAVQVTEEKKGLFKLAKVTPADAQQTAQARFPTGTIKSGELEQEGGKLIYSFDIQQPGVTGIEEVHVDAATRAVIKTEHENPPAPKVKAPARPKPKQPMSSTR